MKQAGGRGFGAVRQERPEDRQFHDNAPGPQVVPELFQGDGDPPGYGGLRQALGFRDLTHGFLFQVMQDQEFAQIGGDFLKGLIDQGFDLAPGLSGLEVIGRVGLFPAPARGVFTH